MTAAIRSQPKRKVVGLLVTGDMEAIIEFHIPLAGVLNGFDRKGRTQHYALWNDPPRLDAVIEHAKHVGVSVQEIVGAGDNETYRTLYEHPGAGLWHPKHTRRRRPAEERSNG